MEHELRSPRGVPGVGHTVDSSDNIILSGVLDSTVDFGGGPLTTAGSDDVLLVKLDPSGNHMWSANFGDSGSQRGGAVDTGLNDDIVVTGFLLSGNIDLGGGSLSDDAYVAKFDADGNHIWSTGFDATGGFVFFSDIKIDPAQNIVVVGSFLGSVSFGGATLNSVGNSDMFVELVPGFRTVC